VGVSLRSMLPATTSDLHHPSFKTHPFRPSPVKPSQAQSRIRHFHRTPSIRNPQSAIRNPQSAIRNPQSAIRNPQSSHPFSPNPSNQGKSCQLQVQDPPACRSRQSAHFKSTLCAPDRRRGQVSSCAPRLPVNPSQGQSRLVKHAPPMTPSVRGHFADSAFQPFSPFPQAQSIPVKASQACSPAASSLIPPRIALHHSSFNLQPSASQSSQSRPVVPSAG